MQIESAYRTPPLNRIDKDKTTRLSEFKYKREMDKFKITELPPELTLEKPKNKTWSELLSPWLLSVGFVIFVALLNGLIGE